MAQLLELREQVERCRRLARDCTDESARDTLLRLGDEYSAKALALDDADSPVENVGSDGT
jgi:hypothetical protein